MPFNPPSGPPVILSDTHAVPTVLTDVLGYPQLERSWPLVLRVSNDGSVQRTYRLEDAAGKVVEPTQPVPVGSSIKIELDFEPIDGLKEIASGAGLVSKAWGYTTS